MPDSPHTSRNRRLWDLRSDEYQATHGPQLAASGGLAWGVWQLPEAELQILGDVRGREVLELGCGAAQWSIALHGLGAKVTGLNISERQLEHARALMADAAVDFALVHSSAEATPFDDASFEIVFCDYGAMTFADPYRTVPEAARILSGFTIESLIELRPPAGASSSYRDEADREWARRWPLEHVWRVRRTGAS